MKIRLILTAAFVSLIYVYAVFGGAESVRQAVLLCVKNLVPGIFCSVVFSLYLVKSGLWTYFGKDALCAAGLLCGFPTGAIMASSLYEKGEISKKQAERICFLYSLPSPAFVISVVGGEMYGSILFGAMLYAVLILSLLVCDTVFYPKNEKIPAKKYCRSFLPSLTDAVSETGTKCLTISSFVIFFYVLGSILTDVFTLNGPIKALALSFVEMTRAVKESSELSPNTAFVISTFALAFSGVSVGAQVGFYASCGGISMKGYFEKRAFLAVTAVLISLLLLYLPAYVFAVFSGIVLFAFVRKYLKNGGKNKKDSENTPYERFVHKASDKAKGKA